jgi:nucleoside-diphosphate kinase
VMVERTLALIKPEAVEARIVGSIVDIIENSSLQIVAMQRVHKSEDQMGQFYASHKGRPYYLPYIKHMSSGPIVALILEGEDAVKEWRILMGETDPTKAKQGTIRRSFGKAINLNIVHGSDSTTTAGEEIAFFWPT